MSYGNLRQFVSALESAGELRRVSAEVGPALEIAEVADRVSKAGGPALLFEHVKGSAFPVLINGFGSYKRMQMALNCNSFDEIGARLESLLKTQPPEGLIDKIRMLFTLKDLAGLLPT